MVLLINTEYSAKKLRQDGRQTRNGRTYSDSVDEVHVRFYGQRGVLNLHQLREDHRQLDHLAEVDVDVVDPVRQRRVQQDEVFEVDAPADRRHSSDNFTSHRVRMPTMKNISLFFSDVSRAAQL